MRTFPDLEVFWLWSAHAPAADTPAVVTLTAPSHGRNVVASVIYSYSADPTAGSVTITDGTTTIVVDVAAKGVGVIDFIHPFCAVDKTAVTITVAAGGGTVKGKVNVQYA